MEYFGKYIDFLFLTIYNTSSLEDVEMEFLKKNVEHVINFAKYIWERIICIILVLVFITIITIIFFSNSVILTPENVESQQILFSGISLENLGVWFTSIALIATALWSMYQYTKNKISKQQEKASEIAQDFSNTLIEKMGIISDVLMPNHEIQKMVTKIVKSKKLNQFTTLEIRNILEDEKCFEKCDKIIHSKRTQGRYNEILKERYNDIEQNRFDSYFPLLVENTLNHLEAICINISSQAAGSQFIYDSLHQSFLRTVEILSIKISSNNHNNVDKYFTNIIQVYDMWNKQKTKDIRKLRKTQSKIDKLNNKAKKEINTLLSKKNKTV